MKLNLNNPVLSKEIKLRFRSIEKFQWNFVLFNHYVYFCLRFYLRYDECKSNDLFHTR